MQFNFVSMGPVTQGFFQGITSESMELASPYYVLRSSQEANNAQNHMHCSIRTLEMNEHASSLWVYKVNECWQQ